jgi:hypothetical protein
MTVYYNIGSTGEYGEHIDYLPDREKKPIRMECSIPHMATGVSLTPEEALDPKWADLFREAHAEWFRPLLSRMAAGERVSLDEIKKAYQDARGTPLPTVEDPRDLKDDDSI